MNGFSIVLFLLVIMAVSVLPEEERPTETEEEDDDDISDNMFKATNKWQEIKKGQVVPPGLHYRINLQTGLKEAKLLEEDEKVGETNVQVVESKDDNYGHSDRRGIINKSTKLFTRKELREMLKKIKDESPEQPVPLLTTSSEGVANESMDKLKSSPTLSDLRSMLTFHADVEIMLQRLEILVNPDSTVDEMLRSLDDLEYVVHQIDNARDFDVLGGLVVIIKLLNHSNNDVQCGAALVLGSATQSNPEVQKLALLYDVLPILLSLLSSSSSSTQLLYRRVLYALSSLLRGQYEAIQLFIKDHNGVEKLSELTAATDSETVLVKIITIITDLLSIEGLEEHTGITTSDLQNRLHDNGWCDHTNHLLTQSKSSVSVEKCVLLIEKLLSVCYYGNQYKLLLRISKEWTRDEREKELIEIIDNILSSIKTNSKKEL